MRLLQYITTVTGVIAAMLPAAPGTAGADPTPTPSPGYQIAGPSGPQFPRACKPISPTAWWPR